MTEACTGCADSQVVRSRRVPAASVFSGLSERWHHHFPRPQVSSPAGAADSMKTVAIAKVLIVLAAVLSTGGCLTRRTVTQGGVTVKEDYVITRPVKEIIENSR